jgi:hypothetical protein
MTDDEFIADATRLHKAGHKFDFSDIDPRRYTKKLLDFEIKYQRDILDDWFVKERSDYPFGISKRYQTLLNEQTRRELRLLGWLASAFLCIIAFALGVAMAFLI